MNEEQLLVMFDLYVLRRIDSKPQGPLLAFAACPFCSIVLAKGEYLAHIKDCDAKKIGISAF